MELSAHIEGIFTARADEITLVELCYKNGGKVRGTIRKMKQRPLRIVIQKSDPQKGERPRHRVVFDHVTEMKIIFQDGTAEVFPA